MEKVNPNAPAKPTTAVATTAPRALSRVDSLKVLMNSDRFKADLKAALPGHMTADRQARILCTILTKNPKLADCDQASLFMCMMDCSAMGLEPDGRRAHLIPFGKTCTLIVDYKGLVELIYRSGKVDFIDAFPVYANELLMDEQLGRPRFEIEYGQEPKVFHKPILVGPKGAFVGAYCIAHIKDISKPKCVWMDKEDIDAIRARSKCANSGPWVSDYVEMAKKTTIRRISKMLPLSYEINELLMKEIEHEHGNVVMDKAVPMKPARPGGTTSQIIDALPAVESTPEPEPAAEEPQLQPAQTVQAAVKQPAPAKPAPAAAPAAAPVETEPEAEDNVPMEYGAAAEPEPQPEPEPVKVVAAAAPRPVAPVAPKPAPAPPAPARPAGAPEPATGAQIEALELACADSGIPERQLCKWASKTYRITELQTIKSMAEFAPRRVSQILSMFGQFVEAIKATPYE